ncbi:MAG: hypothetical protein U5K69_02620 [Balneolaceae bacterium]|nr:hypothetical protein [Balneolaceae bacterium]
MKKAFVREKDRKIQDAKEALRASERAEWQSRVADALEQFEVGGLDQTHDEMLNRLNEETAKNEARMELALDSIDTETMEIEANAEKLRASELVKQFKSEMGKGEPEIEDETTATDEQVDIEDIETEQESEQSKTIGKKQQSKS